MTEKTKVLYDVSQAVKELSKLDKKVTTSGKVAKKSFGEVGDALNGLGNIASRLDPRLAGVVGNLRSAAAASGGMSVALGGAVAAGVAAVAVFSDIGGALRSADDTLGRFNQTAANSRRILDALSATQDARRNVAFEDAKDAIVATRGILVEAQNANDIRKEAATEALRIERDKLGQLRALASQAARETLTAEQRLAQKRAELAGDSNPFSDQAAGRQVGSLTAKAKQLANSGRVDEAEALIERAKQLAEQLGNHKFFTDQIASANRTVVKTLEKDVSESKKKESTLKSQLADQESIVAAIDGRVKNEASVTKHLARQLKLLGQQTAELSRQRKFERRLQDADQGAREVTEAQGAFRGELKSQLGEGDLRKGFNKIIDGLKGVTDLKNLNTADKELFDGLEDKISNAIKTGLKSDITPQDIENITGETEGIRRAFDGIKIGLDEGTINKFGERFIERSEPLIKALETLAQSGKNLGAVGLNESIPSAQGRLRSQADQAQAGAKAIASNINIQTNIKGGVFDADSVKGLADVIRREVRKEVTKLNN